MEKREVFQAKPEFFIRNGAVLMEKQIASFDGDIQGMKIFTAKELERATNNYADQLIVGTKVSTVYRGILEDRTVAIKTPKGFEKLPNLYEFFMNQIVSHSQIFHRNVVKFLGCCLETEIPILVQEFLTNGSLANRLNDCKDRKVSWQFRLKVAEEIGYALSYLHGFRSQPIVHRDVKSSNIFFDDNFTAKLSNFGFPMLIPKRPKEEEEEEGGRIGTYEYLDPEYRATGYLSDKCDVYSFGVVLVELLNGKTITEDRFMLSTFKSSMEERHIANILDCRIAEEEKMEQFQAFANLALKCLSVKGEERPTMKETVLELRRIKKLARE